MTPSLRSFAMYVLNAEGMREIICVQGSVEAKICGASMNRFLFESKGYLVDV